MGSVCAGRARELRCVRAYSGTREALVEKQQDEIVERRIRLCEIFRISQGRLDRAINSVFLFSLARCQMRSFDISNRAAFPSHYFQNTLKRNHADHFVCRCMLRDDSELGKKFGVPPITRKHLMSRKRDETSASTPQIMNNCSV